MIYAIDDRSTVLHHVHSQIFLPNLIYGIDVCFFYPRATVLEHNRHVKSVKIGASLFLLIIATYTPLGYAIASKTTISGYLAFVIYINNFANFFIYFWIDEKFRKAVLKDFRLSN